MPWLAIGGQSARAAHRAANREDFLPTGRWQTHAGTARRLWAPALLLACLFCRPAAAFVRENICGRQENINGWSHPYKVEGLVLRGLELNRAKQNMHYRPGSLYVVLLWDKDNSTAIELDAPRFPDIGQSGRDERGNRWEVWKGQGCR
jgi:hypothetical protein